MRYISAKRTYEALRQEPDSDKIAHLRSRALQELIRAEERVWTHTQVWGFIWLFVASAFLFQAGGGLTYANVFAQVSLGVAFSVSALYLFQTLESIRTQLKSDPALISIAVVVLGVVLALLFSLVGFRNVLAVESMLRLACMTVASLASCWPLFQFCKGRY